MKSWYQLWITCGCDDTVPFKPELSGPNTPAPSNAQSVLPHAVTPAGRAGNEVGPLSPICAPTMLPGPPLAAPVPTEPAPIVPTGNVPLTEPGGKLLKAALAPTNPPTMLFAPDVTAPPEVVGSI